MVKKIIAVIVFCLIGAGLWAQEERKNLPFDSVEFSFGEITYQGKPYTGSLIALYDDGSNKASAYVENGVYAGSVRTFYKAGQTHFNLKFINGKAVGIARVYYPNGELKLEGNVTGLAREGGVQLKNISYWPYYQNNRKQKFKGSARFVMLTKEGLQAYDPAHIPADKIFAFALFDKRLANKGRFIENSSEMYYPF